MQQAVDRPDDRGRQLGHWQVDSERIQGIVEAGGDGCQRPRRRGRGGRRRWCGRLGGRGLDRSRPGRRRGRTWWHCDRGITRLHGRGLDGRIVIGIARVRVALSSIGPGGSVRCGRASGASCIGPGTGSGPAPISRRGTRCLSTRRRLGLRRRRLARRGEHNAVLGLRDGLAAIGRRRNTERSSGEPNVVVEPAQGQGAGRDQCDGCNRRIYEARPAAASIISQLHRLFFRQRVPKA
jgi:hypothetical protein